MKMKKIIASLLVVAMIFGLAACGGNANADNPETATKAPTSTAAATKAPDSSSTGTEEKDPGDYGGLVPMADANDPITFKIFIRDPSTAPSKDNPILKKITELTGVTIEYEFLVGDLDQKVGVMIAGEDYPDAIFADNAKFIDAGAFIPIEDLLPNYPNLYKHYSPYADKMTAPDGHQYILELYGTSAIAAPIFEDTGVGFWIQKAVLEEANTIPHTLDEYFTLIENYKAKYPEIDGVKTVGFEILCDGWRDFCLRNPAQHLMGAGNDGDVFVDLNTMTASLYQITDTAKAYYKKLNEEYQKGIIEAECLTESYDQYISRLSTGSVLGFFDQGWNFNSAIAVLKTDEKYNRTYVAVPIANEGVQDGYLDAVSKNITGNNGLGISVNCKNPERLLAFFDWLLQREVQDYIQWGVEGVDYIVTEDNGKMFTEEGRVKYNNEARRRDELGHTLYNYSPKRQGLYEDGAPCGSAYSADEFLVGLSEYDQKFLDQFGFKYFAEFLSAPVDRPDYYPVWSFAMEEGSASQIAHTDLETICRKYYPQLILCDPSEYDTLWTKFVTDIDAADMESYLKDINDRIAAFYK